MSESQKIGAEIDRLRRIDAARNAARKRLAMRPNCKVCGGRIFNGRCTDGGSMMSCGLFAR